MIIKVEGEHNFFLFQDIVYFFLINLQCQNFFPLKSKYINDSRTLMTSYYIYESWFDVLRDKLKKSGYSEPSKKFLDKRYEWIVTTNIAILKAQIGRKEKQISSYDYEYVREEKPSFLIEYSEDYTTYIVHLEGTIKELFNEAVYFWNSFKTFTDDNFYALLKRYYLVDEDIKQEIHEICANYAVVLKKLRFLDSYEIVEEEK